MPLHVPRSDRDGYRDQLPFPVLLQHKHSSGLSVSSRAEQDRAEQRRVPTSTISTAPETTVEARMTCLHNVTREVARSTNRNPTKLHCRPSSSLSLSTARDRRVSAPEPGAEPHQAPCHLGDLARNEGPVCRSVGSTSKGPWAGPSGRWSRGRGRGRSQRRMIRKKQTSDEAVCAWW